MLLNRRRWFINVVLLLALLAFVGFFTVPLFYSVFQENKTYASNTQVSTPPSPVDNQVKLEEQAKGFELVLQRESDNRTALRGLLEARLQLGDLQGAVEVLERLAKLNPEQTDYTVLLAQAKQQVGDKEGSAQAYRNVLASKPGDMNALQGLVSLFVQEKRPEAAIGLLQETLKSATQLNQVQPDSIDSASVQLLLGQVYVNEQRYTEAIAVYDEDIKNNKQDFRPVLAKALVLQQLGKISEAKPLFTTAVSLAPAQYKDQIKQMATEAPASAPAPVPAPAVSPSTSSKRG